MSSTIIISEHTVLLVQRVQKLEKFQKR